MKAPTTRTKLCLPGWLHDLLERHLEQDVELPILPEAAARVVALCEDEDTDARAIEEVLERDPSLAAHVLRMSNSSVYAPKEPIVSLQQAVSRLGQAAVRNAVLGKSLHGRVFKVSGHGALVRSIWAHCVVAAAFAREVARRRRSNVEAAFLCGLLHDVGKPVALQGTIDALSHRTKEPLPASLLETAMDEFHEDLVARMTRAWNLADWTVSVVSNHHHPGRAAPHEELARITQLADHLADWALDQRLQPEDFGRQLRVLDELELYPDDVDELLAYRGKALEFAEALH